MENFNPYVKLPANRSKIITFGRQTEILSIALADPFSYSDNLVDGLKSLAVVKRTCDLRAAYQYIAAHGENINAIILNDWTIAEPEGQLLKHVLIDYLQNEDGRLILLGAVGKHEKRTWARINKTLRQLGVDWTLEEGSTQWAQKSMDHAECPCNVRPKELLPAAVLTHPDCTMINVPPKQAWYSTGDGEGATAPVACARVARSYVVGMMRCLAKREDFLRLVAVMCGIYLKTTPDGTLAVDTWSDIDSSSSSGSDVPVSILESDPGFASDSAGDRDEYLSFGSQSESGPESEAEGPVETSSDLGAGDDSTSATHSRYARSF